VVRKQYLPWVLCALLVAIGVPALASGEERGPVPVDAAFSVHDNSFDDAAGGADDHAVSITTGGKVLFQYAADGTNGSVHNVDFSSGPAPAECKQTAAGVGYELDPNDKSPLPESTQGPGWAGYCTFTAPGKYTFFCQAHPIMEGTIEVTGDGTPTSTATSTPTVTTTPTATPPAAAARVDAHDAGPRNWWQERGSGDTDASVTIKPGERVAFAFPAGASVHNLAFPGAAPASCPQTKAPSGYTLDANDAPPMPAFATAQGWEGYCTFPAAGTYAFVCGVHPEMRGTVVVQADPTPTATATATATASASPTAEPTASPTATLLALVAPTPTPTPAAAPTSKPAPKITAATFKRSKRIVTVTGTTNATGKVKVRLAYKVGKRSLTKSLGVAIKGGRFSGTLKLPAGDAKKASKLSVTVSAAGTGTARRAVSVKR
jgi:plastocyanin